MRSYTDARKRDLHARGATREPRKEAAYGHAGATQPLFSPQQFRLPSAFAGVALAAGLALGCSESATTGDGGTGADTFFIPKTCQQGVDPSQSIETAFDLAEGETKEEYICPQNDRDFYKVEVPAGKKLLRIKMQHTAPTTPVTLTYRLLKRQGTEDVAVGSAPNTKNNIFNALHCLDPGIYYLLVEDDGSNNADDQNTYQLSYTTEQDKDTNEPNDNRTDAKAISGSISGYISCTGDQDWFKVTAAADQLIAIKLSSEATSAVDLKYTLYLDDGGELKEVATEELADGSREKVLFDRVYAPPKAGTYYVVVQDAGGDDSDVNLAYTLSVSVSSEPDANDKSAAGRNDHPSRATVLGSASGTESCSAPKTFTIKGRIASLADVDFYRIDAPATLPGPAVMEITVDFGGKATVVDPAVGLVLGHAESPCTEDKCCRVLQGTEAGDCRDSLACEGTSFACIERGPVFCQDCLQDAPIGCDQKRSCAGAVVCLPSKTCGYQRFLRSTNQGATLRTAQPVTAGGPWYIRVGDERGDEWDGSAEYTLTVKICADPDGGNEPNNNYYPRLHAQPNNPPERDNMELSENAVTSYLVRGERLAKPSGLTIPAGGGWSDWISGYISYEHDEDYWTFANPCAPDLCILQAEAAEEGSCPGAKAGPGLEFIYTLDKAGDLDGFPGPNTNSNNFLWGDDGSQSKCSMLVRNGGGTFTLNVGDLFHNNWSWTCKYKLRFRVLQKGAACPKPCRTNASGACYV